MGIWKRINGQMKYFDTDAQLKLAEGGQGSGNFGHAGRPGEVGGSSGEGDASHPNKFPTGTPAEVRKTYTPGKSVTINSDKAGFSKGDKAVIKNIQFRAAGRAIDNIGAQKLGKNDFLKIGVKVVGKAGTFYFHPGEIEVQK